MKNIPSITFSTVLLAFSSFFMTSCGSLESQDKKKAYTGGPVKLERPSYSQRPYRKDNVVRNDNTVAAPYRERTPIPQSIEDLEPVPFRVNGQLITPGGQLPAPTQQPAAAPNIFLTPDDLALPTDNQVSDGL